jgi:hypothetical protein
VPCRLRSSHRLPSFSSRAISPRIAAKPSGFRERTAASYRRPTPRGATTSPPPRGGQTAILMSRRAAHKRECRRSRIMCLRQLVDCALGARAKYPSQGVTCVWFVVFLKRSKCYDRRHG